MPLCHRERQLYVSTAVTVMAVSTRVPGPGPRMLQRLFRPSRDTASDLDGIGTVWLLRLGRPRGIAAAVMGQPALPPT